MVMEKGQPEQLEREEARAAEERRSGEERRKGEDRRSPGRVFWERRSGQDRRGHPLYKPRNELAG